MYFKNSVILPANGVLEVKISKVYNPWSLYTIEGFVVSSGDDKRNKIEEAYFPTLTTTTPGQPLVSSSTAEIVSLDGVLEVDSTY